MLSVAMRGRSAVVTLDRPEVRNAVDEAMVKDSARRIAEIRVSPEGREGISAFLEKRKPAWTRGKDA